MTASLATLNPAALVTLADCEQRIERGLRSFVDIGQALAEIRDGRLYKGTHESFEAYCHERWDIGRDYADRMIAGASVVLTIVSNGLPAPTKESQARALVAVPEAQRADVWRKAVERTNGKPTAKAVEDVLAERAAPAQPERAPRAAKAPDRKPLGPKPTAEVEAPDDELLATVVSVLADAGPFGKSTAEIWTKTTVHSARVAAALELLAEQGRVTSTEAANGTARWALSETPGTDGAAQEPPAVPGATPEPDGSGVASPAPELAIVVADVERDLAAELAKLTAALQAEHQPCTCSPSVICHLDMAVEYVGMALARLDEYRKGQA